MEHAYIIGSTEIQNQITMSDTKTNPVVPPASKVKELPTREQLKTRLSAIEAEAMKHAGHSNFNPFLWCAKNLTELQTVLKTAGPVTSELVAKVEAIKLPTIK